MNTQLMPMVRLGLLLAGTVALAGCRHSTCASPNAPAGVGQLSPTATQTVTRTRGSTPVLDASSQNSAPDPQIQAQLLVARLLKRMTTHQQDQVTIAYQRALEVIAHNLANVDITGFKRFRLTLQEQLEHLASEGVGPDTVTDHAGHRPLGQGSPVVSCTRSFTEGDLTQTGERLDLAILGEGFLEVQMPDGTRAYTRDGALSIASDRRVVTVNGFAVSGFEPIPSVVTSIHISRDGQVTYRSPDGDSTFQAQLCRFTKPEKLRAIGQNLYAETIESGQPEIVAPGEHGGGELLQGYLERSNVNVTQELLALVDICRTYEAYGQAIKARQAANASANSWRSSPRR